MSLPFFYFFAITGIYILMSWAIYLPYRNGQLHFIVVANMAISAYFSAIMALNFSWPFWFLLIVATIISATIGLLVSFAIGDAPCFSVVIVGFTFIYLVKTIIENVEFLGGTMGLFNIPKILGSASDNRTFLLIIVYLIVLITGILINRFEHSGFGRASTLIFTDKELATSFGVDVKKMGIFLQTWSSGIGGVTGVLYVFIMRSISPNYFTFEIVGICMTIVFVGGYTTMWGSLLAAPLLWGFPLILPEFLQSYKIIIYGVLLIAVLIIKPEGLITRQRINNIEKYFLRGRSF